MGVTTVIKDYGTDILNAIRENDLQRLRQIVEKNLRPVCLLKWIKGPLPLTDTYSLPKVCRQINNGLSTHFQFPIMLLSCRYQSQSVGTEPKYDFRFLKVLKFFCRHTHFTKYFTVVLHLLQDSKIQKLCVSDIKHKPTKKFACPLILAARQEDPKIMR